MCVMRTPAHIVVGFANLRDLTAGGQCDPAAADTEERGSAVWVSRQGNPRTVHILEPTKEFYRSGM